MSPNNNTEIPPKSFLFCLISCRRKFNWYNMSAFIIEIFSIIKVCRYDSIFLCVSRCLSGKLLKLFPNLRLKEEWIVSPEILLAAVPVGAFRIISG